MLRPSKADNEQLRRFLSYILVPGESCAEVRIFGAERAGAAVVKSIDRYSACIGGIFKDVDAILHAATKCRGVSMYITVNPVSLEWTATSIVNTLGAIKKDKGVHDKDIIRRRWFYIDFDAPRLDDTSATDPQWQLALSARDQFLATHPKLAACSIWGSSGNGAWVLVRIDLPNDDVAYELVANALRIVAHLAGSDGVKIDPKTKNASRVMCLAGTEKCKGTDQPDRPWRMVTIDSPDGEREIFDLAGWVEAHAELLKSLEGPRAKCQSRQPSRPPTIMSYGADLPSRIRKLVNSIGPAISGQGGHDTTYEVAQVLINGYGLSIPEAMPYMEEHSNISQPPWDQADLYHKLEQALSNGDSQGRPRGYLLTEGSKNGNGHHATAANLNGVVIDVGGEATQAGAAATTEDPDQCPPDQEADPARLARSVLMPYGWASGDGLRIRFYKGDILEYRHGAYSPVAEPEFEAILTKIANEEFDRLHTSKLMAICGRKSTTEKPPKKHFVTSSLVKSVALNIKPLILVRESECPTLPAWLDDETRRSDAWDPTEVLATPEDLIHLPSFASGLARYRRPATPRFLNTYALPYGFDPNAGPPVELLRFLRTIWPNNQESIDTLQEWFGYLLSPDKRQQKILALIGPTRGGKGTIGEIARQLIGPPNVAGPSLKNLGENFGLQGLIGKPLGVIWDARLTPKLDQDLIVERLLNISSQDATSVPRKHLSDWEGILPTRLMMLANSMPPFKDPSGAIASRFLVLSMTRSFLGQEDQDLSERLRLELPSILLWAIQGWKRLRGRGHFVQPESGLPILEEMRDNAALVRVFLRECCIVGQEHKVTTAELFQDYQDWCRATGRKIPNNPQAFGSDLRAALPELTTSNPHRTKDDKGKRVRVRYYYGLKLKPDRFPTVDVETDFTEPAGTRSGALTRG